MIKNSTHKLELIEIALVEFSTGALTAFEAIICIAMILHGDAKPTDGMGDKMYNGG